MSPRRVLLGLVFLTLASAVVVAGNVPHKDAPAPKYEQDPHPPWWFYGAIGGAALAVPASAWALPHVRFAAARWLWGLPGFTRFERSRVLDHESRQLILHAATANPGITFGQLQRMTELPKGTLAHHVRMLERHGLLRSERAGIWTRFFPPGARPRRIALSERQAQVLDVLQVHPWLAQQEVAELMQMEARAVAHHLDRLEALGLVRVEKDGRFKRYATAEGSAAA